MATILPPHSSNFQFLSGDFPLLANIGESAEHYLHTEPPICLGKLRLFGEKVVDVLYEKHGLSFPTENTQHGRLKDLKQKFVLPLPIANLLFAIKDKGNLAVHENKGTVEEASTMLQSAFRVAKWLMQIYGTPTENIEALAFRLPPAFDAKSVILQLEKDYKELEEKYTQLQAQQAAPKLSLEEAAEIQTKSFALANQMELSEAETRELIDQQLRQAGWEADTVKLKFSKGIRPQEDKNIAIAEWPVGTKKADYALFIGLELYGIVEAKKKGKDVISDLSQAKVYAKAIDDKNGAKLLPGNWNDYKVPFLFATNGRPYHPQLEDKSGTWFLDARKSTNHPNVLKGWYSPNGLKDLLKIDADVANAKLTTEPFNYLKDKNGLGLRDYQIAAIEAVEEVIKAGESNKALVAMATGTGKTRTIIGLCYRLIKAKRFKRILFLVDRSILGKQSSDRFKDVVIEDLQTFASIYDIKDLEDKKPDIDTTVHFATVQGMVKRIFYTENDKQIPSVDTYDCIIIDEAHRGYTLDKAMDEDDIDIKDQRDFQSKYKLVLDYFDAFKVGLTATPALHTVEIFGKPVYRYTYRQAVIDGFLIDHEPPHLIKTELNQKGITWEKGQKPKAYDRTSGEVVELDELEDELKIEIENFNKLVITESFNRVVMQQLVKELDPEGKEKTLIFAATDEHADLVVKMLKQAFEAAGIEVDDDAIKKITGSVYNAQGEVTKFQNELNPNIVVTVDLLSTGVDVPEICNIVFLRRIKSRILYEQMLGRATRRADHIGKETFKIYDAVRLYEALEDFTDMKPVVAQPTATFEELVADLEKATKEEKLKKQIEEIIAKLQRKKNRVKENGQAKFQYLSGGKTIEDFIAHLQSLNPMDAASVLQDKKSLFRFLDEMKGVPAVQLISEHLDKYVATDRGYGKGVKPEDYLGSFKQFILENQNSITALQIICTRPKDLTRKALKELLLELDAQGYTVPKLKTAWKESKNQEVAADIIAYIRTLALGDSLISQEERIKKAMQQVKAVKNWSKVQLNWLERIEKQLLKESILEKEAFDLEPFKADGGYPRLNKIFENDLDNVIETINQNLYTQTAS